MATPILADSTRPVTGGIDTHKDTHVAAVIDHLGRELATQAFPTNTIGYQHLLDWMRTFGTIQRIGIEGTGSWGAGLTRHLLAAGIDVTEINRTNRQHRRRYGKTDPDDAIAAARACLAGLDTGTPKTGDGPVEAIRMLRIARRSAVQTRTRTMNQIRSMLDTAPANVRDRYRNLTPTKLTLALARTRPNPTNIAGTDVAATVALRNLARRWQFLADQIAELDALLENLVTTTAPNLLAVHCVGVETAAALLIAAGDNPQRLGSQAAFAALCGVNPIPASSGKTVRYRLNRAGNRDANSALFRIVLARMSHDQRTRDYVERRTAEGRTKREIIRILKRYVARELYPILVSDLNNAATGNQDLGVV